jgi:CRP/FNR family transcriptional regulator, cyclic AMP receptor protein
MENLERVLREHPFLIGLPEEHVRLLTGCAQNVRFSPGELLLREGDGEPRLYLLRQGTVALEAHRPGKPPSCVETLGPGDVLGVSWALGDGSATAAAATMDARARDAVLAFALDGACLRDKMATDDRLGHALSRRLLERIYLRLARLRLQSMDVYG